jgi:hypothetical protein
MYFPPAPLDDPYPSLGILKEEAPVPSSPPLFIQVFPYTISSYFFFPSYSFNKISHMASQYGFFNTFVSKILISTFGRSLNPVSIASIKSSVLNDSFYIKLPKTECLPSR